jgi:hypothetical protein
LPYATQIQPPSNMNFHQLHIVLPLRKNWLHWPLTFCIKRKRSCLRQDLFLFMPPGLLPGATNTPLLWSRLCFVEWICREPATTITELFRSYEAKSDQLPIFSNSSRLISLYPDLGVSKKDPGTA